MTTVLIDPSEDAPGLSAKQLDLGELSALCREMAEAQERADTMERALKEIKAQVRVLSEQKIPEFLSMAGLTAITLSDGTEVTVGDIMTASVSGKALPAVLKWLKDNGYDGLIKTDVTVTFSKGKLNDALSLRDRLTEMGFEATCEENVNTGSFKALMKELLNDGASIPLEDLGVYVVRKVVLNSPKGI